MKIKPIRYAVVGLGDIAQEAVLPAFKNCEYSKLTALVSGDASKLRVLGKKYGIKNLYSYKDYESCLQSGEIDAVYIALPNHLHRDFTIRAAEFGIHVLCEKPMAVNTQECKEMIDACAKGNVRLMIAYRLHFEQGNLHAIDLVNRKQVIGEPKLFQSMHSQVSKRKNVRTLPISEGGGPSYDLGVYDFNAARYIFRDEPISVSAEAVTTGKGTFKDIEETMSVVLKFPKDRLASIIYSFGAADVDIFRVAGTKGNLTLDPAFRYTGTKELCYTQGKRTHRIQIPAHDHFSPEIDYFSECLIHHREPEPGGLEGLADVRLIEAAYISVQTGEKVELGPLHLLAHERRPGLKQEIDRSPVRAPTRFHAASPIKKQAS